MYLIKAFLYACLGFSLIIPVKTILTNKIVTAQELIIIPVAGLALALLFRFFLIKPLLRSKVKKMLADPKNFDILPKGELIITSSGIEAIDSVSTTNLKWAAIVKEMETKEYFFLYLSSYRAITIPKRILSEADLLILNKLLKENINLTVQLNS
jgi:preprotein translocase subunit YajC